MVMTWLPAVFFSAAAWAADSSLFTLETGLNDLVLNLSRSVVTVEASTLVSSLGGPGDAVYSSTLSSGIVVDSLGHVLVTARNVIGQDHLVVRYDDRAVPASILAIDYQSELALLECQAGRGAGLPVDYCERQTCAGQMVVTMGHAYGVRAAPAIGFCAGMRSDGAMQFSVQSAPTALGGGVFDLSGRLLGMITGRLGANKGVTLAAPAHMLPALVNELLTHGDRHSGFVGITTQEVEIAPPLVPPNSTMVAYNDSPATSIERGLLVTSVVPASPAQRAGLLPGDLIFSVNSMAVNSAAGLSGLVKQSLPGARLEVGLLRGRSYQTLVLTIGRKSLVVGAPENDDLPNTPDAREVDSLRRVVDNLKAQLMQLEHRLDDLN